MRKLFLSFILLICVFAQAENLQVFGVKSGKIVYELGGNNSGTKTVWFDDYGRLRRTELQKKTTVKIFGMENTTTESTLTIMDGEHIYNADLQENSGYKQPMPNMAEMVDVEEMTEAEQQEFYDETLANLGGEKLGTEEFLGRTCDLIKLMGSKSWIYKGITLKNETSLMGITTNETAIDFAENVKVSADRFIPPAEIAWQQSGFVGEELYDEQGYEEDNPEDFRAPGMTYDYFENQIGSTELAGYRLLRVEQDGDQYLAVFMQTPHNSIMISATAYDEELLQQQSGDIDLQSKFSYRGKDAYFTLTPDGLAMLNLILPQKQTMISYIKMSQAEKAELLKIADGFGF